MKYYSLKNLNTKGWEYIPNAIKLQKGMSVTHIERQFFEFASFIGEVSEREGLIRSIKANRYGDTYSTSFGFAPLHTDSSYYSVPERLICVLCIVPAKRGGALNLLRASDAISHLQPLEPKVVDLLHEPIWYFSSPPSQGDSQIGPIPVITDSIRWRPDVMWSKIEPTISPSTVSNYFDLNPNLITTKLEPGDIVIIDNRKTLHGRSEFNDKDRFNMRIRVW